MYSILAKQTVSHYTMQYSIIYDPSLAHNVAKFIQTNGSLVFVTARYLSRKENRNPISIYILGVIDLWKNIIENE